MQLEGRWRYAGTHSCNLQYMQPNDQLEKAVTTENNIRDRSRRCWFIIVHNFPNFLIAKGALFVAMRHKRCSFWYSVTIIIIITIITRLVLSITSYYHYYCCHCCCYYYSCTRLALFSPVAQMRTHLLGQHPFSHRYIYPGWKDNFCDCGK